MSSAIESEIAPLPCVTDDGYCAIDVPPLVLPPTVIDIDAEDERATEMIPQIGDRILVVREEWCRKILEGKKTMEIRSTKTRPGLVWLGFDGNVYGQVEITHAKVLTEAEFRARADAHLWPEDSPVPYTRLCGWNLANAKVLPKPVPYWRQRGPIAWIRFRSSATDKLPKAAAKTKAEGKQGGTKRKAKKEIVTEEEGDSPEQGLVQESECPSL